MVIMMVKTTALYATPIDLSDSALIFGSIDGVSVSFNSFGPDEKMEAWEEIGLGDVNLGIYTQIDENEYKVDKITSFSAGDPSYKGLDISFLMNFETDLGTMKTPKGDYKFLISNMLSNRALVILTNFEHDTNQSPVPEPASIMLFGLGLLGIARVSRQKS